VERLEAALVQSVAGRDPQLSLAGIRRFRAPHHSSSIAGLIGGGSPCRPGEISLAHTGVLFLDELPEFGPSALQALRQPMEEGVVTLVRAQGAVRFPARVQVVGAMNPCPCGYAGDPQRQCACTPGEISKYESRVGGPLFDRMDLTSRVNRIDPAHLLVEGAWDAERSCDVLLRVRDAREYAAQRRVRSLRAALEKDARDLLQQSARQMCLSGRGVTRVLRVARTIADLAAMERIGLVHVAEALTYRGWEAA
jgi:magnesium chelatase family protein